MKSIIMKQTAAASLKVAIPLIFVVFFSEATLTLAQDTCGSIGNSNENVLATDRSRRFYLDTANPAPCTGSITSWRVCYYGPNQTLVDDEFFSYWATYAIYRKMGSGADEHYEQVSQLFSAVTATNNLARIDSTGTVDAVIRQQGFTCYDDSITTPLTVQAGDIVGACVFNPTDGGFFTRRQLDVVGRVNGESLLRMGSGGCSITALPMEIRASQLSNVNSRRLHIYANIGTHDSIITTQEGEATSIPASTANVAHYQYHSMSDPTVTSKLPPTDASMSSDHKETDQELRGSLIATMAGSASGILLLILFVVSLIVVMSVVMYLKRRQKAFSLTPNVAYAGQCKNEDIDYNYSISQPSPENDIENRSIEEQPLTAILYSESQPTISHVPETNEEVVHTIIEHHTENGCSLDQPSPVLYDTIEETQAIEVLQSGTSGDSSPTVLNAKKVSHEEPHVSTIIENIDYGSSYSSPVNLEAQQLCEGVNLEQNVAYKPISTTVQLSPNVAYGSHNLVAQQPCKEGVNLEQNVAYEPIKAVISPNVAYGYHDHVHQSAESQDEYEYISNGTVAEDTNDL